VYFVTPVTVKPWQQSDIPCMGSFLLDPADIRSLSRGHLGL